MFEGLTCIAFCSISGGDEHFLMRGTDLGESFSDSLPDLLEEYNPVV
jgi:hypothetical protein